MRKALVKLGFTDIEAKVYIQLTKEGPQSPKDIAKALKRNKHQICNCLKIMKSKGFVEVDRTFQTPFFAVPFPKVLDLLIKDNIEQAKYIMKSKKELLSSWQSIINRDFLSS